MMSERVVVLDKRVCVAGPVTVEVRIGWTDVFSSAMLLLEQTESDDVRWVHVERARKLYDGIRALYDTKKAGAA